MQLNLALIKNNLNLKVVSFIIAFSLWYIMSFNAATTINVMVPVCFYDLEKGIEIQKAAEEVRVNLAAKKSDLYQLDFEELAVHVAGDELKKERNKICITSEKLFLPEKVKLVHCTPSNVIVTCKREKKQVLQEA